MTPESRHNAYARLHKTAWRNNNLLLKSKLLLIYGRHIIVRYFFSGVLIFNFLYFFD